MTKIKLLPGRIIPEGYEHSTRLSITLNGGVVKTAGNSFSYVSIRVNKDNRYYIIPNDIANFQRYSTGNILGYYNSETTKAAFIAEKQQLERAENRKYQFCTAVLESSRVVELEPIYIGRVGDGAKNTRELKRRLGIDVDAKTSELTKLKEKCAQLETQCCQSERILNEQTTALQSLEYDYKLLQSKNTQLETVNKNANEAITRLEDQHESLLEANRQLKKNNAKLSLNMIDLMVENGRLIQVASNSEIQISALKGILERKEETIVSLQKELTAVKQENLKQLSFSNTLSGEVERQEEEFKKLRLGIIAKQQKLDAQQEWNAHLTAECTRLLAYEKATKEEAKKWKNPKLWDVWNLFLDWLFPTDQKPSSQLIIQMKEEYRKQHKEKF